MCFPKTPYIVVMIWCSWVLACSTAENERDYSVGGDDTATAHDEDGDTGADADSDGDTDSGGGDNDVDGDADSDSDADSDADTDTDSDSDTDSNSDVCEDADSDKWCADFDCDDSDSAINEDAPEDPADGVDNDCDGLTDEAEDTDTQGAVEHSYLWVANSGEGTVSKIDTRAEVEVARYITGPLGAVAEGDPSRTSVNLYGDVVVANRRHPAWYDAPPASSVAKFAASIDDCVDHNASTVIDTSSGPTDVRPWGEEECMLWHTELPNSILGARTLAWDGTEDPLTGEGGNVWVGTCQEVGPGGDDYIYKLDGDTGEILETVFFDGCAYGGAIDANHDLWIVDRTGGSYSLYRLDTTALNLYTHSVSCGYGIAIDSQGRIWSSGGNNGNTPCASRYDPANGTVDTVTFSQNLWGRGVAAGVGTSAGYMWVAISSRDDVQMLKIDEETMQEEGIFDLGGEGVGIGIDYEGYVWYVSGADDAVYKFDPVSETYIMVPVGLNPYTYSDMTGVQLATQVVI